MGGFFVILKGGYLMESTEKFTNKAEDYTLGRPFYAKELIAYLYSVQGFSRNSVIADIGSGTGKFSKQLLDMGSKVFCVEPNNDMRCVAESSLAEYPNFISVNAVASDTTLNGNTVDFITVAQAFHWFDVPSFQSECRRLLKENGKVFLIWNTRDESDINRKIETINNEFCPNFKGFSGGIKKDDERIKLLFSGRYEYIEFDNPLFYDYESFVRRCRSSSYALSADEKGYEDYYKALTEVFYTFQKDGILKIPNKTVSYFGTI